MKLGLGVFLGEVVPKEVSLGFFMKGLVEVRDGFYQRGYNDCKLEREVGEGVRRSMEGKGTKKMHFWSFCLI